MECISLNLSLIIFVQNKSWAAVQISKGEPLIYHLLFGDDILLFVKTDSTTLDSLQNILNHLSNVRLLIFQNLLFFFLKILVYLLEFLVPSCFILLKYLLLPNI